MASQNIDPARMNATSQKRKETTAVSAGGGHSVTQRLQKDLMTLMTSGETSVSAFPELDDMFHWKATIFGPASTLYEGLEYKLTIEFPDQYPYSPPTVKFVTPCYHPNVDTAGNICLDILKEKWSALMDVRTILLSIQVLLSIPNNESPLNTQAAQMWEMNDPVQYKAAILEQYKKGTV